MDCLTPVAKLESGATALTPCTGKATAHHPREGGATAQPPRPHDRQLNNGLKLCRSTYTRPAFNAGQLMKQKRLAHQASAWCWEELGLCQQLCHVHKQHIEARRGHLMSHALHEAIS